MAALAIEQKILSSAVKLFTDRLFSDVSITDIVNTAAVGRGSFYNYFPTKEDCFVRAMLPIIKAIPDYLLEMKYESLEPLTLADKLVTIFQKHAMMFRNTTSFMYSTENALLRDLLYIAYKNVFSAIYELFLHYLKEREPSATTEQNQRKAYLLMSCAISLENSLMFDTIMEIDSNSTSLQRDMIYQILDGHT